MYNMKKISIVLLAAMMATSAFISHNHFKAGIYGAIDPPEGARKVWAINGRDSASSVPTTGKFSLEVKPGTWKIVVEAIQPYQSVVLDNVLVQENQFTDAGVIKLRQ
jgi:hypothetical protein